MTLALGVLVSGSGSNLQSILDETAGGRLDAEIKLVVSNVPGAFALDRACEAGVPAICLDHRDYSSRQAFDEALRDTLLRHEVEWVALAGFMRILTGAMLSAFERRIVNIHPSLLPAFPGTRAPRQALARGVRISGCTIHVVDSGTDTGPILAQTAVPVLQGDDEGSLGARIQAEEHRLYPRVLQAIAEGRLDWIDGRPFLKNLPDAGGALTAPPLTREPPGGQHG